MFIAYFPAFIYIDVVKFTRVNGGTVGRDFILFYFILFVYSINRSYDRIRRTNVQSFLKWYATKRLQMKNAQIVQSLQTYPTQKR